MNRKIFTLLAGALLMLATVFSASAQSAITGMDLRLGDPVDKLVSGANPGYYHLKVDSMIDKVNGNWGGVYSANPLPDDIVLFMGIQDDVTKEYPLFIDRLNPVAPDNYHFFKSGTSVPPPVKPARSDASASSLWCTVIGDYDQGQNVIFDFTNKQQVEVQMTVDIDGYKTLDNGWTNTTYAAQAGLNIRHSKQSYVVPGMVYGWNFSTKYATGLEQKQPLFSYITRDSVAVLCLLNPNANENVVVKIASVGDVLAGNVHGMLYFTLYEAAPFALDAKDINTMFGTKDPAGAQKLTFTQDVSGTGIVNQFTASGIFAEELTDYTYITDNTSATDFGLDLIWDITTSPVSTFFDNMGSPIGTGSNSVATTSDILDFDKMGYMILKNGTDASAKFLYATQNYFQGNAGGTQFLNIGLRDKLFRDLDDADILEEDLYLFGQSIWRLIYYPSGDSIYINPYQATYLPTWNDRMMTVSGTGDKLVWTDELVQSSNYYTFRAHYQNLETPNGFGSYETMTSRLKYGTIASNNDIPEFFRYYHHNYVTIQTLTGNVRILTLGNGSAKADHTIDTWIRFNLYKACSATPVEDDRRTVPSDLYLIRSKVGNVEYFLNIPLYSATDSAIWTAIEPDVHPEYLPSYQWAVLKRVENATNSIITMYNREFDGTYFEVQLTKSTTNAFNILNMPTGVTEYWWNNKAINSNTASLAASKAANNTATFISLPADIKKDAKLGYSWVDPQTAQVTVYALNLAHGIDANRYIDWKGDFWKYPNTDTTVYVTGQSYYDRLYFKLDTVEGVNKFPIDKYGFVPKAKGAAGYIEDLVRLERRPYRLTFEDPYKMLCRDLFNLTNGPDDEYIMGNYTWNDASYYFGDPIFNLRHVYHKEINGKLVPFFALFQRINPNSNNYGYSSSLFNNNDNVAFEDWLTWKYNSDVASKLMDEFGANRGHSNNSYFKTGALVARVDDQTAKLKAVIRGDESTLVSAFRLVEDDDPIYRRFNTVEYDGAEPGNEDAPKFLKFHWMDNPSYHLFENTGLFPGQKTYWENYGIGTIKTPGRKNYLGSVNINQYSTAATSIYVDTAYINRGTGWIKPQYLLLVDPTWPDGELVCDEDGNWVTTNEGYLRGRYLINATDSARGVGSGAGNFTIRIVETAAGVEIPEYDGRNYLWDANWERLVFTDAIHAYDKDALYFANWPGVTLDDFTYANNSVVSVEKLEAASAAYNAATSELKPIRKVFLGNNDHKDVVFQMRLIERGANDFIMESETGEPNRQTSLVNMNRIWGTSYGQLNSLGKMIAPCVGGWVKIQNGPGVISRSDVIYNMAAGDRLNVKKTEDWPTANEPVAVAAPTVIGGDNAITILGAAGKKVTVSNVLGQTVAGVVLSSDNVTISAPKGVVIVAIEGESAVKTLVK